MKLELTIQDMFDRYPTLFKERFDCLDHLFICIGNGFKWKNGELVDNDYKYTREYQKLLKSHLVDGKAFQHNKLSLRGETAYYHELRKAEGKKDLFADIYTSEELEKMYQKHLASLPDDVYYKHPRVERWYDSHIDENGKPYIRLCKNYAKLFNYPEDIKPDWLAAIEETKRLLIEDFGPDVFKDLEEIK